MNLQYDNIHHDKKNGYSIQFKQQKSGGVEVLPISDSAIDYLPNRKGKPEERVFTGLKYSAHLNMELKQWVINAGIRKTITFHCARHSFASIVLELTNGDMFMAQKLLGHRGIKTTQLYSKMRDQRKIDTVKMINKIL